MLKLSYPLIGLVLATTTAYAQDAPDPPPPSGPETGAAAPADLPPEAPDPADAVPPADVPLPSEAGPPPDSTLSSPDTGTPEPSVTDSAEFTDEQVDQFAEATVKVQAINADTSIATEDKQARMAAAVTESGLDPATYNEIGRAVAVDPELRNRVQVAMSRHAANGPTGG